MKLITLFFAALTCLVTFIFGIFFFLAQSSWIDFSVLENYNPGKPTLVLDDEGQELFRFQLDKRDPVPYHKIPKTVIQAFLAAEDREFFNHHGISWRGIMRSSLVNISKGRIVQGASTITQQLVKLLFLDNERTFKRKIKEQIVSRLIEQQCTKEQILETYLNHIYFGCGIYGIEAASQRFFSKSVTDLTLEEAATLAGVVRSPARYCPLISAERSYNRRNVVVQTLVASDYITQEEAEHLRELPLTIVIQQKEQRALHVREMVRIFAEKQYGKHQLYTGGFIIQTTLNKNLQDAAEKVFNDQIKKIRLRYNSPIDGGLVTLDAKTAAIKVLIGGYNFVDSQFNRAKDAQRQMGSIFKPLVFSAALQKNLKFTDIEVDEPFVLQFNNQDWRPYNFNKKFNGQITRAYALAHSNNIVTIKTLLATGFDPVINLAKRAHIKGPFFHYPSLALGCVDGTLLEAAGMFNIFANRGDYVTPYYIEWIKDSFGKKIFKHKIQTEPVLSWKITSQVASVLNNTILYIKKRLKLAALECEAIGKTGTTNDARTCWFCGSTPAYTTAIYLGNDDNKPMGEQVFASFTAFPIWYEFNKTIEQPEKKFIHEPSLKEIIIDEKTGKIIKSGSANNAKLIKLLVE